MDNDTFFDNSSLEHLYICRQLLAIIKSNDQGFIETTKPSPDGFTVSIEFKMGFYKQDYEVLEE